MTCMALTTRLAAGATAALAAFGVLALTPPASAAPAHAQAIVHVHRAAAHHAIHRRGIHVRPGKHKVRMRGCHTHRKQTFTVSVSTH